VKDVVEGYLKEHIDTNVNINQWNEREWLPIFLSEFYTFYKMNILGEYCLLIEVKNEVPGIEDLKKHMKTISKCLDDNLVILIKSISSFRRKTLIENRISFIVENGQMYLPFLGMQLKKVNDENVKIIKNFSSSTQLLFLYFLYNKELLINTTELAGIFNTSIMTASRALNDLHSLGLLTCEISGKTGRSKRYKRIADTCYYNIGSKYLNNPVSKVEYIDNNIVHDFPIAGLEALSMQSMLNPPKKRVRAISKQKARDIKNYVVLNRDKIADMDLIELQIWNYEPKFLAKDGVVDLMSLIMSISETNDERVQNAIEERLKCEIWYTE